VSKIPVLAWILPSVICHQRKTGYIASLRATPCLLAVVHLNIIKGHLVLLKEEICYKIVHIILPLGEANIISVKVADGKQIFLKRIYGN